MNTKEIFRKRLREARQAKGLSQQKVADYLGLTKIGYQNYEAGRTTPSFDRLPGIARFFGVSLDYLLGLSDDPHLPQMDEETKNLFLALKALKGNMNVAR